LRDGALPGSLGTDALRLFVRAALDSHRDAPELHRVLFEEAPHPPDAAAHKLREAEAAMVAAARVLLAEEPSVRRAGPGHGRPTVVASIRVAGAPFVGWGRPEDADRFESELTASCCTTCAPSRPVLSRDNERGLPCRLTFRTRGRSVRTPAGDRYRARVTTEQLTVEAINALKHGGSLLRLRKESATDLNEARRRLCRRYIRGDSYRMVEIVDPPREPGRGRLLRRGS